MNQFNHNLAALIGSRICHDLISPIGALTNGLELLELSGAPKGMEMAIIADSAANANARIRLFRLAFGQSDMEQTIECAEVRNILEGAYPIKPEIRFLPTGDMPKPLAQLVTLSVLCLETALPFGGSIIVAKQRSHWSVRAESERVFFNEPLWRQLTSQNDKTRTSPSEVQFCLMPILLAQCGWKCAISQGEKNVTLSFTT